jgi:serine phosphatase RsbU (regulator of sigma subunit)
MSIARATLRALALHEHSPQRLLTLLNEALLAQVPEHRFVTVCCALVQPTTAGAAEIVLTRAGHPAPVLCRKGQTAELVDGPSGILLGMFTTVALGETTLYLEDGDTITLYTDGVESREQTAQQRALRLLAEHGGGPPETIAARFAEARPNTAMGKADDLVVLTLAVGTAR